MADTITIRDAAAGYGFPEFEAYSSATGDRLDDDSHCIGVMPTCDKNVLSIFLTDGSQGAIYRKPPLP